MSVEPVEIVDSVETGEGVLALRRRGAHFDVVLGNVVLLSSAALGTEIAFGQLAAQSPRMRVLVGGLGFGGTARGVLASVGANAEVIVVEKVVTLERWLRGPLQALAHDVLADPRVHIVNQDVFEVLGEAPAGSYSAILLDVDNGPNWASFRTNARLYAEEGLRRAREALAPGGLYAVWSGYDAPRFVGELRRAGFQPETVMLREGDIVQARAYVGRV